MVEFALSIPLILLLLIGIVYFGRYFFASQCLLYAAQEASRVAARVPNLADPSVRDAVRGFTADGAVVGPDDPSVNPSPVYAALSAAKMLSSPDKAHGNLPPGASVKILPWDDSGSSLNDTVRVEIEYPFSLTMDFSSGESGGGYDNLDIAISGDSQSAPVSFDRITIKQSATCAQEIYQE